MVLEILEDSAEVNSNVPHLPGLMDFGNLLGLNLLNDLLLAKQENMYY